MKNYALINPTSGRVEGVVGITSPEIYYDGAEVNGQLCKILPSDITPQQAVGLKRWTGSGFIDMPVQPNKFYVWTVNAWEFDNEAFDAEARAYRNSTLASCDWTQVPDAPLTEEQVQAWKTYRQALRDLPANLTGEETTVEDAPWPTPPTV